MSLQRNSVAINVLCVAGIARQYIVSANTPTDPNRTLPCTAFQISPPAPFRTYFSNLSFIICFQSRVGSPLATLIAAAFWRD